MQLNKIILVLNTMGLKLKVYMSLRKFRELTGIVW